MTASEKYFVDNKNEKKNFEKFFTDTMKNGLVKLKVGLKALKLNRRRRVSSFTKKKERKSVGSVQKTSKLMKMLILTYCLKFCSAYLTRFTTKPCFQCL